MKTKFKDFINESLRDKMTPKMSTEEYKEKVQPLINEIKEIIKRNGEYLTMAKLEEDYSPVYSDGQGKGVHLIERLKTDCVEVIQYDTDGYDDPLDEYDVQYEDLDFDTLTKIKTILDECIECGILDEED